MGVPTFACAAQVDAPTFLRRTLVGLSQPAGESASSRASPQPSQPAAEPGDGWSAMVGRRAASRHVGTSAHQPPS